MMCRLVPIQTILSYAEIIHIAAQQGVIAPPQVVNTPLAQAANEGPPQIVATPPTEDANEEPLQAVDAASAALGVRNPHQFILSVPLSIIILIVGILIGLIISRLSAIMP